MLEIYYVYNILSFRLSSKYFFNLININSLFFSKDFVMITLICETSHSLRCLRITRNTIIKFEVITKI